MSTGFAMRNARVRSLLAVTVFVMAVLPLAAAFYLVHDALRTSLDLGFNPQIMRALEDSSTNLRTLARLDPENRERYRVQFEHVEELARVYSEPELVKQGVLKSLRVYFGLGFCVVLLLSIAVAALLSREIASIHADNVDALNRERDKVRYLEEMSSWQELAKMLAHEIKNPLTPIEVLVSSLSKAYLAKGQREFLAHLSDTQAMIGEELNHLKSTVNKFSEFARLPQVQLAEVDLPETIERQLNPLAASIENADIRWRTPAVACPRVRLDVTLFRQVLANILRNGVEANPGRQITFDIVLEVVGGRLILRIANDGVAVPTELAGRMFDPYVSAKSGKDNMGLGLAIVKKIVLEHGGEVRYSESDGAPEFIIELPGL